MKRKDMFLIVVCIAIILSALLIGSGKEFLGADDQIKCKITEIDKNYKPWSKSIWKPPSGEIEGMLFSIQAAIGAGFIGYYIGRKRNVQDNNSMCKTKQT